MKENDDNTNLPEQKSEMKMNLPGYLIYPPAEDIYSKFKQEKNIDPEDISKLKELNDLQGAFNEKDFDDDVSGSYLDAPGSELYDEQDNIESKYEENNYFNSRVDYHNDLETDRVD